MLTWAEIARYIRLLRRWWAVLFLAVSLASGTALILTRRQPTYYATAASLMVGDNFNATAPNQLAFDLSNTLAGFYGELAHREVILKPVTEKLQLPFPWQIIADRMLSTSINRQANLLEISVVDSNPERAAAIANGIAQELIAYSPTSPEKFAAQRAAVEEQITSTDVNLKDLDQKIAELKERQTKLDAAVDLRDIQDQIDQLQTSRDKYQETYNQLLLLRNNSSTNSVSLFEQAEVPSSSLASRSIVAIGMAGLGGLFLAILAILVLDKIDERWRNGRDLRDMTGVVDLGDIPPGPPLLQQEGPSSTRRERAVREAHARIILAANGRGAQALLVCSPETSEARSSFSIDLAHLFARSGHRVLLVDADLSAPNATRLIKSGDTSHETTTEQAASYTLAEAPQYAASTGIDLWSRLQTTSLPNVMLLAGRRRDESGLPMLVPSLRWPDVVDRLRTSADVVIFDGPAVLSSADAALLAPLVDGVVLALDPAHDTRSAIVESKKRLMQHDNARLLGAVLVADATKTSTSSAPKKKSSGFTISIELGNGKKKPSQSGTTSRSRHQAASEPSPDHAHPTPVQRVKPLFNNDNERVIVTPAPPASTPGAPSIIITPPPPPSAIITPIHSRVSETVRHDDASLQARAVGASQSDEVSEGEVMEGDKETGWAAPRPKRRPVPRIGRYGRRGTGSFGKVNDADQIDPNQ